MLYKVIKFIRRHLQDNLILYFILIIALILGNILGPFMLRFLNHSSSLFLLRLANPYFKSFDLMNYSNSLVFKNSIISNGIFILAFGVSSLFPIGIVVIPALLVWKGISIGFVVAYLVFNHGIRGFIPSFIAIYPQNLFIIFGMIGLGGLAMSISNNDRKTLNKKIHWTKNLYLNELLSLIFIYIIIIIFGSFIEGFISSNILRVFLGSYI